MRLIPSDPDVETIVGRIKSGDLDLQPEFQRGEVWTRAKKQKLIDSILRDWHVPPIHVIENAKSQRHEVLDGQQRLAAIRDFVDNKFPVDGSIEPLDTAIQSLGDLYYSDLPSEWRRRFNQFTIRLFRIVDYRSAEPAEIFFRLNQPTSLTGAEQRNAFFGPVREQIKRLVIELERGTSDKTFIGFSNSRMAYDDVLSRTALAIQRNSLAEKITASDLAGLYRSDSPLGDRTISLVSHVVAIFSGASEVGSLSPKFNKATLFSWLMVIARAALCGYSSLNSRQLAKFLEYFEVTRMSVGLDPEYSGRYLAGKISVARLFSIYENRSSARVADVSSVILRDAVLWLELEDFASSNIDLQHLSRIGIERLHSAFRAGVKSEDDDMISRRLISEGWGQLE